MVRAFVALELSGEIREEIRAAQETLRSCSARLTFVDPPLIHITLKFLGEVDERILPKIIAVLRSIPFVPFTVTAGRVTVNNPRRPHTVWCEIEDGGKSRELFRLVEAALGSLGFVCETRPFTPHATLARVKVADPSLFRQIDLLKDRTYGSCAVTGLKLKKSTLTPKGPVYEDLLEVAW